MVSFQDGGKGFKRVGGTAGNRINTLDSLVSLQTVELFNGPLPCFSAPTYGTIRSGLHINCENESAFDHAFHHRVLASTVPHRRRKKAEDAVPSLRKRPLVFLLSCQNGSVSGVSSPLRSFAMMRHIRAVRVKGVMRYQPSQLGAARRARATERDSARASAGARSRPS